MIQPSTSAILTFICCRTANFDTHLVMGDDTITVTGGEQSIRGVENAKDGGLAKATETLSVKSLQEGDVYDSICPLKVNAIK